MNDASGRVVLTTRWARCVLLWARALPYLAGLAVVPLGCTSLAQFLGRESVWTLPCVFAGWLWMFFCPALAYRLLLDLSDGQPVRPLEVLVDAVGRSRRLLLAWLASYVLLWLTMSVIGLLLVRKWVLVPFVLLAEQHTLSDSLRRARELRRECGSGLLGGSFLFAGLGFFGACACGELMHSTGLLLSPLDEAGWLWGSMIVGMALPLSFQLTCYVSVDELPPLLEE